jgi:hypothetical protein
VRWRRHHRRTQRILARRIRRRRRRLIPPMPMQRMPLLRRCGRFKLVRIGGDIELLALILVHCRRWGEVRQYRCLFPPARILLVPVSALDDLVRMRKSARARCRPAEGRHHRVRGRRRARKRAHTRSRARKSRTPRRAARKRRRSQGRRQTGLPRQRRREPRQTMRQGRWRVLILAAACTKYQRLRRTDAHPQQTHLSLHPSPVVNPMPPLNSLPSLCRCLRLSVSRSSRGGFFFPGVGADVGAVGSGGGERGFEGGSGEGEGEGRGRSLECGERRPARSMRCLGRTG